MEVIDNFAAPLVENIKEDPAKSQSSLGSVKSSKFNENDFNPFIHMVTY